MKELQQIDQKTRKLITIDKTLDQKITKRYCMRQEEAGRVLTSIEYRVYESIRGLVEYIKESKEILVTMTRNSIGNIKLLTEQQ